MKLGQIRTPEDVYDWMDENIQYGWLDTENGQHIGEMKNFRKSYRTIILIYVEFLYRQVMIVA